MSYGPLTMISVTRLVGEQPLERTVAEDVVGDLVDEPLAIVARDARLLRRAGRGCPPSTRSRSASGSMSR